MKKTLTAFTVLVIAFCFSINAFAASQNQGQGQGKKYRQFQAGPQGPKLTEEQQTKLKNLRQEFIDDTYEMRAGVMTLNQQIRMYMETSNPDTAKLKSMVIEKADLEKDLAVRRMEFALDAGKIAPELKNCPMGFMGMGRGPGGPGMGPGPGQNGFKGHGFSKGGFGRGGHGPCWDGGNALENETPPESN